MNVSVITVCGQVHLFIHEECFFILIFLFEFTVIADTKKVAQVLTDARKDAKERKFIDVVLETCIDDDSKNGDILVYLMGGFHNSAISKGPFITPLYDIPHECQDVQFNHDTPLYKCQD